MLVGYFSGLPETLILIPKKNGKTTLLAALALYHLTTTDGAACFIAAASRDQATILYDQAKGFIRRSEWLQEEVEVKAGYRQVRSKRDAGLIRVLAADADTADGVIPTLALVDELHRHKSADLYGVFRDGLLGDRSGQMVTISTAGDNEDSPLGRLRRSAYALPVKRTGAYRYAASDSFALHEWALEDTDDLDDLNLVLQANPAPWQTKRALRDRKQSPSMQPWQWARFACGVWQSGEHGAIAAKEWQACAGKAQIPDGAEGVHIGVDLGWKWDTTAIVPVWADKGKRIVGRAEIVVPPRDGTATEVGRIQEPLEEMAERWPEATVVVDPEAGGEQLAQWIESELGLEVIAHSQKPVPMSLAAQRLSEDISAGRIVHLDDAALNRQILAAAARPVGEGFRFVKARASKLPIDGAIALAMANSVITTGESQEVIRPMIEVLA